MKGKSFVLLFVATLLLFVAATGFAKNMETFTLGLPGDAKTLDPHQAVDTLSFIVTKQINEPLVTVDGKTKQLVPVLAERWEILDPQTYKFFLKKGVKFHNGEELTAEDVVFSLKRAASKDSLYAKSKGKYIDTDGFQIIDKYTLIVKTHGPVGGWLDSMKHPYASIFSKKAVESAGAEYFRNPVGTGPFKFKSWAKGDRITLERNEEYWGKKPAFKTLVMRAIPEATNRTIELESGAIDIAYQITTNDLKRVQENPKLALMRVVDNSTTYMGLNCSKAPFDNPKVRKAVSLALDTVGIQKAVWRGVGKAPVAPIAPNILYAIKDAKPHVQDVEAAKKLLAEAGVKLPLNVQIWTNERKERIDMATIIQSQLEEVGIKAEIKVLEWGAYLDGLKQKTHDMFILGWVASVPDPEFAVSGVFIANSTDFLNI